MTKITRELSASMTRRGLFKAVAGTAGAVALVGLTSNEVLAAKMTKQAANYQATPKGGQTCAKCQNFTAPSNCSQVDGPVSPNGWCTLFNAKA
ncbi:MAG: high potential iron sulfur protein [Rhodopseudomonas sp.]|uniref:high potential iron sulfur protein n=1 Tax=Rhodopseudomonas sp. TaxID=1078 RepID=UPI0017CC57BB|nr:high potential iron sulfur protein [Rhodopseudomonas sp.]NVN87757.1 high potential iron sulfur protein [Rhodopseudomonas sp.]